MFIIKLRNWIISFKLARLLVTHDGGKLTLVGELSLAEHLQGRQGNPLARVTLALWQGYQLRNWIIPFKLARLLVTHEGGKLTLVGELSLAEHLQGRQGNPLARVTLALWQGYQLRNWIIPFKLARLLVTHEGGKLTLVGELSLAEHLQGRQGNPLARVTLAPGLPCLLVNRALSLILTHGF